MAEALEQTSAETKLSERLKALMFELGPSRYILMRELFLADEALRGMKGIK